MLKIAICDDEQCYLLDVKRLLDEYGAAHGIELAATDFSLSFDLSERVESGVEFGLYLLDIYARHDRYRAYRTAPPHRHRGARGVSHHFPGACATARHTGTISVSALRTAAVSGCA